VRLTPKEPLTQPPAVIYNVTTVETPFMLTRTTETNLCGYKLYRREHPKLPIMETRRGTTFKTRAKITVDNLDLFSYVNSKFVYVEKYIKEVN